jgi:hypothetical protein
MTTMIVGVAFVAVLQLIATGTTSNLEATDRTTAVNFAKSLREWTFTKTYAQLQAMNGGTYQPPKDAGGANVDGFGDWEQKVVVQSVNPQWLTQTTIDPDPVVVRVTVTVQHNGQALCSLTWFVHRSTP